MRLRNPASLFVLGAVLVQLSCSSPESTPRGAKTEKKPGGGWSMPELPHDPSADVGHPPAATEPAATEPAATAPTPTAPTPAATAPAATAPTLGFKRSPTWLAAAPARRRLTEAELAKLDLSQSCAAAGCHQSVVEGKKHYEIEVNECSECHKKSEGTHRFVTQPVDTEEVCLDCHEEEEPSQPHTPYAEHKCTVCHTSLHAPLPKVEGVSCMTCHEKEKLFPAKSVHGPAAVGACAACHDPHGSGNKKLLRKEGSALCLGCHEALGARLKSSSLQHEPATDDCAACHSAHGTDHGSNLLDALPALCLDCHDGIEDLLDENPNHHGALKETLSCSGCHDPHASDVPKLLREATPLDTCLKCHTEPRGKVMGIGRHLEKYPNHHGPIRKGECAACHDPHASKNQKLLRKAYPRTFYTQYSPEAYALCNECHASKPFETARTTTLTGFRDGDRNLHFLHVNRERKGRTCRACHDVHASKQPFLIAEGVPFGNWRLPLNFTATPTGGACASGCHEQREYSRSKK